MYEENLEWLAHADAIEKAAYELFYSRIPLPDKRQVNVFKQYLRFVNLAFQVEPLDNILELGAGFSTILLARLAHYRRCNLFTVDIAFDRVLNRLEKVPFFEEGRVGFPDDILKIFSQVGDEFDFYNQKGSERSGVLDDLLQQTECFDLVFFDSGEFSSFPEWVKLKDHIRPGGIAVFHDIYFPKSFKNFLTCSAVTADPKCRSSIRIRALLRDC